MTSVAVGILCRLNSAAGPRGTTRSSTEIALELRDGGCVRSPATNLILVAMAQSDMLTGLWPLPCYVNFYTLERAVEYVPHAWCFVYHCLSEYLPTICHTASVWLTVGLAVHRYAALPVLTYLYCLHCSTAHCSLFLSSLLFPLITPSDLPTHYFQRFPSPKSQIPLLRVCEASTARIELMHFAVKCGI